MACQNVALLAAVCLVASLHWTAVRSSPSPADLTSQYGGIVVGGGVLFQGHTYYLKSVEVAGTYSVPDLLAGVYQNTITAVGPVLYSCGGSDGTTTTADCFTFDTSDPEQTQWQFALKLPVEMDSHTAVAVGDHIWFTYLDKMYDLEIETGRFLVHVPPFIINTFVGMCAVSNGSHVFYIGVGDSGKEIWRTTEAYSATSWEKVGEQIKVSRSCECLWVDDVIVMTGGSGAYEGSELFHVDTHIGEVTGDLVSPRSSHKMFVLNSRPAVIGGLYYGTGRCLDNTEVLDLVTKTWSNDTRKLEQSRAGFGLAQFLDY